jgi:hypothetical protein
MFVLQTFWEEYILKNSILDWNTFSYITKQAAAWIQRILKLYFNDFYSVWSQIHIYAMALILLYVLV